MIPTLILVALVIVPIGDVVATAFFFRLFLRSKRAPAPKPGTDETANRARLWGGPRLVGGRSWLLGLMTMAWAIITLVFVLIGYLAVRRLLGQPPFEAGAILTVIGLIALGTIPITFAVAFYLTRRKRGGPPPFSESD